MAELLGTVVAGAQVLDYTLQICEAINNIAQAAGNKKRYQKTGQQLKEIILHIRESPHLRTPIIVECTDRLIDTINDTHQQLCRHRKNQFIASVSFVTKQKKYDSIFDDFERQKTNLALHISQLNNDRLGEITPVVNKIWTKVQCIPGQQMAEREIYQKEQAAILSVQESHTPVAEYRGKQEQENIYPQAQNDHNSSLRISGPKTPQHITASPDSISSKGDADSGVCLIDDEWPRGSTHPEDSTMLSPADAMRTTNAPHPSKSSPVAEFLANINRGGGRQTIGVHLGPNARVTDADMLKATSNFLAHANISMGDGAQVIGQLVQSGASPVPFSGHYSNNQQKGSGDQIVGIFLE